MGTRISPNLTPSILAAIDAAQATAQNARQMVLNRDPKIEAAAQAAAALPTTLADADTVHAALSDRITALENRTLAIGAAPVGLLLVNASTTVTVPLSRTMPATYTVDVAHSAVVNLANVTLTVTGKTTTAVTVKVQAVGLGLAAGTLVVVAR